jgi:1-acyl-sn-glycerol-3-phosphate acyltransferase
MTFVAWVLTAIAHALVHLLFRLDDAELQRVPMRGPLIMVPNHVNFVDAVILFTHRGRRPLTSLVKVEGWRNPLWGLMLSLWGAIPLHRGEADMAALRKGLDLLETGHILVVTPEGTRNREGRLLKAHPGVALLALRSGAPVLPVGVFGHEHLWHKLLRLRRVPFRMNVGPQFHVDARGAKVTRELRQQIADEIMVQIANLLPEDRRGYYAAQAGVSPQYLRFD